MPPLLRTKTSIPPARQNRVERLRLREQIDRGMTRALTLVVAPAGFGKTTLLADWAHAARMPAAWLTLERAEHAADRFLVYLIHALQTIAPSAGQTALAMLQGGQAVAAEAILVSLLNDLSEIPRDFAVILDDYHTAAGPDVDALLDALLEHCPSSLHLGLATRVMPGLALARLRARDQIVEITAADLRFDEAEVRAFLAQMGVALPPEQLARLDRSAEGWAVGLQLAGLALARQPFDWNLPAGQTQIFDYLAQEVLRREPPEIQEFLKISALFDRFCAPVMEHVLRRAYYVLPQTAADLLGAIERANLFLIPLDASRTWFRYHALFAEFLRRQLPPAQAQAHYHAASVWFEDNRLLDEAIHYATHAADHARAADLLETHYVDVIQRGEQSALLEWLAALPPELWAARPRLWLAKGWSSIIALNSAQAEACAAQAEALIPPGASGGAPRLRGEVKALRLLTGIFAGNVAAAEELAGALEFLAEQDDFLHSLLHFNLGLQQVMLGQTALALEAFAETLRLTATLNNPLVSIVAQVQAAEVRQMRGALGLAERAFQKVIRYARETLGERTCLLGMPFISYADLLREQNRFDEAIHYAEQGIAYCQAWQPVASMDGQIALARLLAAQGQWEAAEARLERARQVAENSVSVLDDVFVAVQQIRLTLLRGDLAKARRLIEAYELEQAAARMYFHLAEMTQLVLLRARVQALAVDAAPASAVLESLSVLIAEAERRERVMPVIEALLLSAYAHHAIARHDRAAESLSQALTLGAQSGCVRLCADEGQALLRLLEAYRPKLHAPHAYTEEILNLLRRESTPSARRPAPLATSPPPPLTRRELDILQLLAAGKSNQEIAADRVLTVNTVKKHVANILSKLGVANRTQAGLLAKKRGWLE